MKGRAVLLVAGAVVALAQIAAAQTVQPCPNPGNCVQVTVGSSSGSVAVGSTVAIPVTFQQGPSSGSAGGLGQIAALAMTIDMAGAGNSAPLVLSNYTPNADGLPAAVAPAAALAGFRVVVENASCAGRTHCLCPTPPGSLDNFINLVVYGPNPLPTPGPTGITIPALPSGMLMTISLQVASGAAGGTVPLHVFNQATDSTHPQFTALLSIGDTQAVDQTCSPLAVPGTPPCAASGSVSQVAITDGSVTVSAPTVCTGDCHGNHSVVVTDIITLVNIVLGNSTASACPDGIPAGSSPNISTILQAVTNLLDGCPAS